MNADLLARGYSAFLNFLAEPALRSLVIGGIAAMALAAFRVKRVRARLLVWTAVLCAALAMPLLGAFLPRVRVGVPAAWMNGLPTSFERGPVRAAQHEVAASGAVVRSATTTARISARALVVSSNAVDRSVRRAMKIGAAGRVTRGNATESELRNRTTPRGTVSSSGTDAGVRKAAIPVNAAAVPQQGFAIPWTALVLGVYLLGAAVLLARVLIGVWFSRRLARAAQDVEDREVLRVLRFRAAFAGLTNVPQLKESAMLAVPATVGVRRAVILLPADWRTWSQEQLDAILAHEVSHVARRDALTQMLSLVHRAIFWFSPLGWWLDKQLTDLAEQASDEAALAGGADRTRYAETLVGFFKQLGAASGRVWWQGVSMAKAAKVGNAERRVDRILAWRGVMSMKKSFAVALIAIAAPIVFLAASVHPFIAYAQDKPPAPPRNVVQPGGPAAPALTNAPKALGVAAPALAPAPKAGGPAAPPLPPGPTAPAPGQGVENLGPKPPAPSAPPALAGASAPGNMATPPALAGPRVVKSSETPAPTPAALTSPVAHIQSESSATTPAAAGVPGVAGVAGVAGTAGVAGVAGVSSRPDAQDQTNTIINGSFTSGGGPRYVMMSGNSNEVTMSGSDEDLDHARELRRKISGDFIWFERDEKSYVITDPAFIAKAKALFAPEDALSKQQDELSRQQDALSKQQDALSEQQDSVKVKVPDISPDIKRIQGELDALRQSGATQSELGRLQSELGQLQSQMGRYQSEAGVQQSQIGRQQGELGRQQGELGRKQGDLGRQQGELARKASQQLREMFNDAIANGIAKPE
jgi:beta-lactamase regulating signal transducer with metallopeptidase domain